MRARQGGPGVHGAAVAAGGGAGGGAEAVDALGERRPRPPPGVGVAVGDEGGDRDDLAELRTAVVGVSGGAQGLVRGELPADIDMGLAVDLFGAPLYFRMLAVGGPTDEAYVDRLTRAVLTALAASR